MLNFFQNVVTVIMAEWFDIMPGGEGGTEAAGGGVELERLCGLQ